MVSQESSATLISLEVEMQDSMRGGDALKLKRPAKTAHACKQIQDNMPEAHIRGRASSLKSCEELVAGERDLKQDPRVPEGEGT